MEGLELKCFELISNVGNAKSLFVEAIREAKEGNFDEADLKIKEGEEFFIQGHRVHAQIIQCEANGQIIESSLLLIHSEDQLMSAETIKLMADELIDSYKTIYELKDNQGD